MPAPENAQTGWEIFKASDYEMTLAEINDELATRGHPPVSPRMHSHYRKLHRYGYEQYIPINQLDVKTMEDPAWDRALRGRYPLYSVEEAVRVLLIVEDDIVELSGVAEEISDGEVVLRLQGQPAVETFEQAKTGMWTLQVVFTGTGEIRLCEVAKVTLDRRRVRVTVRATFVGIDAPEGAIARQLISTTTFRIVVGAPSGSPLLGRTAQQIFWLFSGAEGVRIAVSEIVRRLDDSRQFGVPANRVERLSVASPMEALIVAAGPVLVGAGLLLTRIIDTRKSWWEGTKAKHEAHAAEEEVRQLRWERQRREVVGAIDLNELVGQLAEAIRAELGLAPIDETPSDNDPALRALATQALPALAELVEAGGGEVSFVRSSEEVDQ